MITEDAVDGPGSPPGRPGGMVTRVMALYWEDVDAAWRFFSRVLSGVEVYGDNSRRRRIQR